MNYVLKNHFKGDQDLIIKRWPRYFIEVLNLNSDFEKGKDYKIEWGFKIKENRQKEIILRIAKMSHYDYLMLMPLMK